MKSPIVLLFFSLFILTNLTAQEEMNNSIKETPSLPYHQIPDYPDDFSATNVAARMIDGLGYRYYWATESLRDADLAYTPGNDGKNTEEVLDHIFSLSNAILCTTNKVTITRPADAKEMTWEEKRKATLENFKIASDNLKVAKEVEIEDMKVIFKRGEKMAEFPFWNMINGQIADAIYHTGQIVSYRRSAGNPTNPFMNVFSGKTKNQ